MNSEKYILLDVHHRHQSSVNGEDGNTRSRAAGGDDLNLPGNRSHWNSSSNLSVRVHGECSGCDAAERYVRGPREAVARDDYGRPDRTIGRALTSGSSEV